MKKFLILLLVLLLSASSALAAEKLRVGMECDYTPFNWTQSEPSEQAVPLEGGGYADGYDVRIAKKIAEDMGRELEIVKTVWDGLVPALTSGKIDLIVAGMSPTEERKATIDFSDRYYLSDLVIVVRNDSPYAAATALTGFSGARITGQQNTVHYTVIDQIEGVNKMTAMESFPAMIVALKAGGIDGYVSERPGALAAAAANPELGFVGFDEGSGFSASEEERSIAVGIAKGSALTEEVNRALNGISEEERQQIMADAAAASPLAG